MHERERRAISNEGREEIVEDGFVEGRKMMGSKEEERVLLYERERKREGLGGGSVIPYSMRERGGGESPFPYWFPMK